MSTNNGSCLCGDIKWKIDGDIQMRSNCHCSMCRKLHGAAYGSYIGVPASAFTWISGEDNTRTYESSPGGMRPFCPRYGSVVAATMSDGESVLMPLGNMDGNIDHDLDRYIFVASKAPWFDITDEAEQVDEYPDEYNIPGIDNAERAPATADATGGSCLCDKVRFEFDEAPNMIGYCHCSRCRRAWSAPHSTLVFVAIKRFRWLKGEDNLTRFHLPDADIFTQTFCCDCGSVMPTRYDDMGIYMVPAGSLDQDPGIRPSAHIHTGSMAPWFTITDDLTRFEALPVR